MQVTAIPTAAFVSSIGVNTSLGSSATYDSATTMETEMSYLGVDQARDMNPTSATVAEFETLVAAGIKFDIVIGENPDYQMSSSEIQSDLSYINQVAAAAPGSVIGVEGLNEPFNFPNLWNGTLTDNWTTVYQVQQAEYNLVKQDNALAGTTVLNTSVDPDSFSGTAPNFGSVADAGNGHQYPYGGEQPAGFINSTISGEQQLAPNKPVWITEFGYGTAPADTSYGVDQATQAKNILNGLLDSYKGGAAKTFIYNLNDWITGSTSAWDEDGIFNPGGTPKEAATALHNLTSILSDSGSNAATFTPGQISYTVSNLPSTGNSLLMEKSSGVFDVAVWSDAVDWNASTGSETTVQPTVTQISFGSTYASIAIFDPMSGTSPIATYSNANSVTLSLTDHPLIVQLSGAPASPGTPTASASPNDTIVLVGSTAAITDTSGNAWTITGGAQVAVNGATNQGTSSVIEIAYVNGTVWQENAVGLWRGETQPNNSWSAGTTVAPLATVVTVPATEASVSVAVISATINATSGNHTFLISGHANTFNLSGGVESITDSGSGSNTFKLPAAGSGSAIFNATVLANADVFDLTAALKATSWTGSSSNVGSYLHALRSGGNTELFVSATATRHGTGTLLATFDGESASLSTILAHSVT